MPTRKELAAENDRLLQECTRLRTENARLNVRLLTLQASETNTTLLSAPDSSKTDVEMHQREMCGCSLTKHSSTEEKITLFQSLFNGRPDVFAHQWKGKSGKYGYSPACKNEWVHGICGKPQMKCSRCEHANYIPYDAASIERHLRGQCVIGIYPLLLDDTCFFLAIDLDDSSWKKDINIMVQVCQSLDVPYAVEISRSGNGAHLWFFFVEPITASIARNFGSAILTLTMHQNARLSFSSYDRMFPNQDTMPKGGFGNLIALPLQKEARTKGYSLFVDDHLIPYEDQWAFLSSIKKISLSMIDTCLAAWRTPPLGTLQAQIEEGEKPWKRESPKLSVSDFPAVIKCMLADMLYISTDGLSDRAQNGIKRLAAFRNPLFFKRKR